MANFVFRGVVRNSIGEAVPGVEVFVCNQPLTSGSAIPPAPLANLFAAPSSNAASIASAVYIGAFIEFTFTGALPADVVPGSFIAVSGVAPTGYDQVWQVAAIDTVNHIVTVTLPFENFAPNPGTYVSGGTVATSALPNPILTDGNGNFEFYAASGTYTLVIFDDADRIPTVFLANTQVTSPGSGTINSVGLTVPDGFAVAGSPLTGAGGTLAESYSSDWNPGVVIAGPVSGGATTPTRRRLTAADIDGLGSGSVSSVGLTTSVDANLTLAVTGSPVTTSGNIAVVGELNDQAANAAYLGPSSGSAGPTTSRVPGASDLTAWGAVQLGLDLGGTSPNAPEVIGLLGTGVIPVQLFFFNNGLTVDAAKMFRNMPPLGQTWKFPAGAPNSDAIASAVATADTIFTFKKNTVPFATLKYGAGTAVGVWTQVADAILLGGTDYLQVDCPATHDVTLADIGITYAGLRVA